MAKNKRGYISKFYQFPLRNPGPFVYYQSLLAPNATFGAHLVGQTANKFLYGASNILNQKNKHERISQALSILKNGADNEAKKEAQFLVYLNNKLAKFKLNKLPDIQTDPYDFINALNGIIRGIDQYQAELNSERQRIVDYANAIKKYGSPEGIGKAMREGDEEALRYKNALHNLSNTIEGRAGKSSGFTTYSASVKNDSIAGKMAETIIIRLIHKIGPSLIDVSGNNFVLNGRQANALVTMIIHEIERKYLVNNKQLTEKNLIELQANIENGAYDDIFDRYSKLDSTLLGTLTSFSQTTINNDKYSSLLKHPQKLNHARAVLGGRIEELKALTQDTNYSATQKKSLKEAYKKFSMEWAAAANSVQPAVYFTPEADLGSLLNKIGGQALFTGKQTKDDIGAIMVTLDDSIEETRAGKQLQQNLREINAKWMQLNKYKKGKAAEYKLNAENALHAAEELEQAYENAAKELDMTVEELKELTNCFVIHGNVKSYDTIDSVKTQAFSGGSMGSDITQQLTNLSMLLQASGYGYNDYDSKWLIYAIINSGRNLIGESNKEGLEKYLSSLMVFLLFDDAQLMIQEGVQNLTNSIGGTTLNKIHLYSLGGTIVPCSYVLYETYQSLTNSLNSAYSGINGAKVTLQVRGADGGPFEKPEDWLAEREAALAAANIDISFMGHFLGFLDNLAHAMNPG